MGVYIKGMEMPTDRSRWVVIYPDGKVDYSDKTDEWETLDKGAVPVPEHGRLIDADALMDLIRAHDYPLTGHFNSRDNGMFTIGIHQAVDETPTIIPAEQAEEGE